jgi:hypothetical protein
MTATRTRRKKIKPIRTGSGVSLRDVLYSIRRRFGILVYHSELVPVLKDAFRVMDQLTKRKFAIVGRDRKGHRFYHLAERQKDVTPPVPRRTYCFKLRASVTFIPGIESIPCRTSHTPRPRTRAFVRIGSKVYHVQYLGRVADGWLVTAL